MVSLIAIYRMPEDPSAFDTHYDNIHTPLVKKMDGIRKIEVFRMDKMLTPSNATLPEAPYLMCIMYFDDKEALDRALASEGGRAAAKDLRGFAGQLVSMMTSDVTEVPVS